MSEEKSGGKISRKERLEQRRNQLERQIKAIDTKEKEKERKERTRRLIQIGAISLKYLGLPDEISPEDFEKVIERFVAALKSKETANNKES